LREEKDKYLEEMNKTRAMIGTETDIGGGEITQKGNGSVLL